MSSSQRPCQVADDRGSITGSVADDANGSRLAGVTVVATSPALQGTEANLTDESGQYVLCNLPTGTYEVTFYYSDITVRRTSIPVAVGKAIPVHIRVNTGNPGGEIITIEEKPSKCIGDFGPDPSVQGGAHLPGDCGSDSFMRRVEFAEPVTFAPCQP